MPDPPGDDWDPAPALPEHDAATLSAVAADLDAIIDGPMLSGATTSALVVDLETGQELYTHEPDLVLKPASNTKLFTTGAAYERLGIDHRPGQVAWSSATIDAQGTLAGDLVVIGDHDFSHASDFHVDLDDGFERMAEALYAAGLRDVGGELVVAGEWAVAGYQFGYYDPAPYLATARDELVDALEAEGIGLGTVSTSPGLSPPAGAEVLAEVDGPSLRVCGSRINDISHNEFADLLMRGIGWTLAGDSSYPGGAGVALDWLGTEAGAQTEGAALHDGSGLSHDNRVSARMVVAVLGHMLAIEAGPDWMRGLSIAGVRGTLAGRMTGPDTLGRFFGKSGTLDGVITTSGVLISRHDGRRYAVALLSNDVVSGTSARTAHNHVVERIGEDLFGAARPAAPRLVSVRRSEAGGSLLDLRWDAVPGADAYLVWFSDDGRTWAREEARMVQATTFLAGGLIPGAPVHVRVSTVGAGGESDPSDVYAARPSTEESAILIVDGLDRWQAEPQWENTTGGAHDFAVRYAEVIAGRGFDTVHHDAVASGEVSLASYAAVLWMSGEESSGTSSFSLDEQTALTAYADTGGNLLISGSEIGWDLVEEGDAADQAFYASILRADYVADDAGTYLASPDAGGFLADGPWPYFWDPTGMDVAFPDVLAPLDGSIPILTYRDGSGGAAGLAYEGTHRVVYLGFPFEAIDGRDHRLLMMESILGFFGV